MTNPVGYQGEPLALTDGRTVHVKYGMRGLMQIEQTFGSLGAVQGAVSQDGSGQVFTPALKLLAAGLIGQHDGNGAPLNDVDRLADLIDPAAFQDAVSAAGKALVAAFPNAPQVGATTEAEVASPTTTAPPFPGPTGTTPPPSPLAEQTPSGG